MVNIQGSPRKKTPVEAFVIISLLVFVFLVVGNFFTTRTKQSDSVSINSSITRAKVTTEKAKTNAPEDTSTTSTSSSRRTKNIIKVGNGEKPAKGQYVTVRMKACLF